ncbi:MAG: hypothetical protein ACLS5E_04255 [[Ruminococcus] lactaris]
MMGAIVGDIVGSVYEWHNIKTKDFPLFRDDCFFTDDTVMTCAVAEAVMNGGRFGSWIFLIIESRITATATARRCVFLRVHG